MMDITKRLDCDHGALARSCVLCEREAEIKRLTDCLRRANDQAEHFERLWYLRGDEIERLQAELAEAKKFKDGMLDVLGGACPNDHRSTPFEEFKGCTPCLRDELAALQQMYTAQGLTIKRQQDELAECKQDADRAEVERLRGVLVEVMEWTERYTAPGHPISTVIRAALANSDAARKGEGV